jgi:hypothetical protein
VQYLYTVFNLRHNPNYNSICKLWWHQYKKLFFKFLFVTKNLHNSYTVGQQYLTPSIFPDAMAGQLTFGASHKKWIWIPYLINYSKFQCPLLLTFPNPSRSIFNAHLQTYFMLNHLFKNCQHIYINIFKIVRIMEFLNISKAASLTAGLMRKRSHTN